MRMTFTARGAQKVSELVRDVNGEETQANQHKHDWILNRYAGLRFPFFKGFSRKVTFSLLFKPFSMTK